MSPIMTEALRTKAAAGTTGMVKPPVKILNNFGHVDKQAVEVGESEQVEWVNDAGQQVQIVFDEAAPFDGWSDPFVVEGKSRKRSGMLRRPVQHGHRYKYTVIGSEGNTDPIIIIEP